MSAPPDTPLEVFPAEEARIRAAVRMADVSMLGPGYRIADESDVAELLDLLSDSRVSDPIYDLPRPFGLGTIGAWIKGSMALQQRGEAVIAVLPGPDGRIQSYSYFTGWPDRSAAEIGGAYRAEAQSRGT